MRQMARLAPHIPGAERHDGCHWRFKDTDDLRRWITSSAVDLAGKKAVPQSRTTIFNKGPLLTIISRVYKLRGSVGSYLSFNSLKQMPQAELETLYLELWGGCLPYREIRHELRRRQKHLNIRSRVFDYHDARQSLDLPIP